VESVFPSLCMVEWFCFVIILVLSQKHALGLYYSVLNSVLRSVPYGWISWQNVQVHTKRKNGKFNFIIFKVQIAWLVGWGYLAWLHPLMSGWVRHDYVRCYNANSSRSVWGKRVEKFLTQINLNSL